ncbi:PREDICTED: phosrestin-2-like, partial [Thamnophis sirtalis]|uniref:Phosrestin-2-like n=1 Tax=Thamnophis sirtalis TaxID=35019 RepID=A0A6I9YZK8_9SAUR
MHPVPLTLFSPILSFCRVFKKASPNAKLTVYLGKRDFVDHIDLVDPVDGVVLVDPEYLKERKGKIIDDLFLNLSSNPTHTQWQRAMLKIPLKKSPFKTLSLPSQEVGSKNKPRDLHTSSYAIWGEDPWNG